MRAYVGQTRDPDLIALLNRHGIGECAVRGTLPPKRTPWFYDNGCFVDWRNGAAFNTVQFTRDLRRITYWPARGQMTKPDFLVLPDLVAAGNQSLACSLEWLDDPQLPDVPRYLAVQDGMWPDTLRDMAGDRLQRLGGIFVGGTLQWKLHTAKSWVAFAHRLGLPAHIGRCGTEARVEWATRIKADSIDSSLPLWSADQMRVFLAAVSTDHCPSGRVNQLELW